MTAPSNFVWNQAPVRVVFGAGKRAQVAAEIDALGRGNVMVTTTGRGRARLDELALGSRVVDVFDGAVQHVPEHVAKAATERARAAGADVIVAFGGGSPIGLAKAIALEHDVVIAAVPTTYAGSEMTSIFGITADGGKLTGRDPRVKPQLVVYDPQLTATMPVPLAMTSGFNSMAHAVEALYAENGDPITSTLAVQSITALGHALPAIAGDPRDADAHAEALYGAFLSAWTLDNASMGLHHKLCHVLGGSYNLPHAPTHTIILPHAIAYNEAGAPEAIARVAAALGVSNAARGLFELIAGVGAPTALKDIGMAEADLDDAANRAMQRSYANPTPLNRDKIRALLDDAYHGRPPRSGASKGA